MSWVQCNVPVFEKLLCNILPTTGNFFCFTAKSNFALVVNPGVPMLIIPDGVQVISPYTLGAQLRLQYKFCLLVC